jgi:endonuclease YncB( thermonuclease family)
MTTRLPLPLKTGIAGLLIGAALGGGLAASFNDAADCALPPQAPRVGDVLRGRVAAAAIHDGDTLKITQGGTAYSVRIFGIDAPETRQICIDAGNEISACGIAARDEMVKIAGSGVLSCEIKSLDKLYNRVVGLCTTAGGTDIGRELVRRGYAYNEAHDSAFYRAERADAQAHRRGLWAGREFMDPKEWRDACTSRGHKGPRPEFCSVLNKTHKSRAARP